jgi:hypothetical protein
MDWYSFFRRYVFVYRITIDGRTERYFTLFVSLRCRLQEKRKTSLFIILLIKRILFVKGKFEGHDWKKTRDQRQTSTTGSESCISHKYPDLNNQNVETN